MEHSPVLGTVQATDKRAVPEAMPLPASHGAILFTFSDIFFFSIMSAYPNYINVSPPAGEGKQIFNDEIFFIALLLSNKKEAGIDSCLF